MAREGHIGVNVFFVLSGFLIALRYADGIAAGRVPLADYFLRRAARILPLYYAVFVLSVPATGGPPLFSWARIPEWTLTQGLFRDSVSDLAVPTSWSLTVEEGFYALAPFLFLAVAWLQRRRPGTPFLAGAIVCAGATILLYAVGAAIWTSLDGGGPGFLSTAEQVSRNTLFGRFYDFAVGVAAALALSRVQATVRSRGAAVALTVAAVALLLMAQAGMHHGGGINGPTWQPVYAWHLLLAPAAAALIASLTIAANPVARVLSAAPLVYLGKISYALYLIQATELAKSTFYRLIPDQSLSSWLLVYAGMTAISAALYELVEEPARGLVLRAAGLAREPGPARPATRRMLAAAAAALALVAGVAGTLRLLTARHGAITIAELRQAGTATEDVLELAGDALAPGRPGAWAVRIPGRWRDGWDLDDRAPAGLRVFVDGMPVAFSFEERLSSEASRAFFRNPRAGFLALRLGAPPKTLVIVNSDPVLEARVHLARLGRSPRECALLAAVALTLAAAGLGAVYVRRRAGT